MQKIALITDSTSDIDQNQIDRYNINVLPFRIIYKEKEYLDNVDITAEEVYKNMAIEVPTSSFPTVEDIENLFKRLVKEGYTHAIAITLSTGLSGIYNAINMVSSNYTEIETFVYDSKSISLGEGALVIECGKLIEKGMEFKDIVKAIPMIKSKIHLFFVVGTLEYLKLGGRIGKVEGTIAELLQVKPIIAINDEGKYYTYTKVRGRKQSLTKLCQIISQLIQDKKYTIYVLHGNAYEEAYKVYTTIKDFNKLGSVMMGGQISPVSGVHSGPGLIGVVCVEE